LDLGDVFRPRRESQASFHACFDAYKFMDCTEIPGVHGVRRCDQEDLEGCLHNARNLLRYTRMFLRFQGAARSQKRVQIVTGTPSSTTIAFV
jgi:hypothetical protein